MPLRKFQSTPLYVIVKFDNTPSYRDLRVYLCILYGFESTPPYALESFKSTPLYGFKIFKSTPPYGFNFERTQLRMPL